MKKKPAKTKKAKAAKKPASGTPKRSADILFRRNEKNEVLVMHLEELEAYFCIDGMAADMWELIDGKRSTTEIVGILAKRHEQEESYIASEAKKLLSDLRKLKLLEA